MKGILLQFVERFGLFIWHKASAARHRYAGRRDLRRALRVAGSSKEGFRSLVLHSLAHFYLENQNKKLTKTVKCAVVSDDKKYLSGDKKTNGKVQK